MSSSPTPTQSFVLALVVFLGTGIGLLYPVLALGYATGVIAVCSSASARWSTTYFALLFVGVPVAALTASIAVSRSTQRP